MLSRLNLKKHKQKIRKEKNIFSAGERTKNKKKSYAGEIKSIRKGCADKSENALPLFRELLSSFLSMFSRRCLWKEAKKAANIECNDKMVKSNQS